MKLHSAKILLDSISKHGHRLTTFECCFPRIILSEWNTHRVFVRNSASSRAIPVEKMIRMVTENPYVPTTWGKNQRGMQAAEEILGEEAVRCEAAWLKARDLAVGQAQELLEIGVHKQTTNRLLEPFLWHTIINTATEYSNFYALRAHKAAHPDIQIIAFLMKDAHEKSTPQLLADNEWHTPYAAPDEKYSSKHDLRKVTSGRCASISYLTHDGKADPLADIARHDRLLSSGHMSPLEHAARPMNDLEYNHWFEQPKVLWDETAKAFVEVVGSDGEPRSTHFCGPFQGWVSYRKQIPNEEDYGKFVASQAAG
jgi:thymidylate synthase ThyX